MVKKFFVLLGSLSAAMCGMEYPFPEETKRDFSAVLPQDVQVLVVDNLLRPDEMVKSFRDIVALARVNKRLYSLVCKDIRFSIQRITQKMEMYPQGVVSHLIQLSALKESILKEYLDETLNSQLWTAMDNSKVDQLQDLLSKKANPNTVRNLDFMRLLHPVDYAITSIRWVVNPEEYFNIGRDLLKAGANVNNNSPTRYFHGLCLGDNAQLPKFARLLFSAGLDVNAFDNNMYMTLLMYAIVKKRAELIKVILEQQPDLTLQDDEGRTAYDIAVVMGYSEIAELIKSHMTSQK